MVLQDARIEQLCEDRNTWESLLLELLNKNLDELFTGINYYYNKPKFMTEENLEYTTNAFYLFRNGISQLIQLGGPLMRTSKNVKGFIKVIYGLSRDALNFKCYYPELREILSDTYKDLDKYFRDQITRDGNISLSDEKTETDLQRLKGLGSVGHRLYINGIFEKAIRETLKGEKIREPDPIVEGLRGDLFDEDIQRSSSVDELILDSVSSLLKQYYESKKSNPELFHKLSEDNPTRKGLDETVDTVIKLDKGLRNV